MKKIITALLIAAMVLALAGCDQRQSDDVSYNLSLEADNFNIVRQITVINCIKGDVLFQMTGRMSITTDTSDHKLDIIVEDENGDYQKHMIGLSDNVTYVIEDLNLGDNDVSNYHYTINYNPDMWLPEIETID